jgi:antitoxin VapB
MTRENTIELSRLCAARAGLCRVALRLWREFVFPTLGYQYAVSYQDADLHNGNTYRFDGWERVGYSHSGTDTRSGRSGRDKYAWAWPPRKER